MPRSIAYYWAPSPDGKRYAYTSTDPATNRIFVIVKKIGSDDQGIRLDITPWKIFKWMPDSSAIYFQERIATTNPQYRAFKIDPEKGQPVPLYSSEPEDLIDITYSRDGKSVAVVRGKSITDAVMLTASASP